MSESDNFATYARLADALIEKATKGQLADVARLLALNIGYYHEKYGDVPQETLLRMVRMETLNEETQRLLLHAMQNLVSALGEIIGVSEDGTRDEAHH